MNSLTRWFLDNPVAANLLMAFILISGLLTYQSMRVEIFPQIAPTRLSIEVSYPGGTASQVDQGITQRIEEAISGVAGIKSIVSQSHSGYALVQVEKKSATDLDKLMEDVRNQLESIVGFPEQAERPKIYRDEFGNLASFVIVHGGDPTLLQSVSTQVQKALQKHPAISQVSNLGKRKRELVIAPDLNALQKYDLSLITLAEQINQWSLEYRSGELNTARGRITLRGDAYADNLRALQNLPIVVTEHSQIRLGDIASIERSHQQTDSLVRYMGKEAVVLMLSTSQKDNLLQVSDATGEVLKALEPTLPNGIELAVMADMKPYIEDQLDLLGTNAWQGLLIVIVVLGLFLEMRLAFWVAMGILISIAGAVALMGLPMTDYSINDITLFGMILVLGILVDDAVVVGESIHHAKQRIADPKQAALKGVESVAVATVYGVLTTIAAFSPMLWIDNELAKVLAGFSAVVIFALIFSLIESKFILPSHLAYPVSTSKPRGIAALLAYLRKHCIGALDSFSERIYQPLLAAALKLRWSSLLLFISLMLAAYTALLDGSIRAVFFPEIPGRYATLKVEMDQDAALELTHLNSQALEDAAMRANRQLQHDYQLQAPPIRQSIVSVEGARSIELTLELSKEALANIPSEQFLAQWQQQTGSLEGSYSMRYALADEPAGGTALTVSADDLALARHVAKELKPQLAALHGVHDVYDDSQGGKRQLQLTLNQRGIQLGIDQRRLAVIAGGAFGDLELHRLLDQGEESVVVVRFPEHARKTLAQLKQTPVYLGKDHYVSLGEISDFSFTRETEVLHRRNREPVVTIYWRQDRSQSSPEQVWQQVQSDILPTLSQQYPGIEVAAVGEFAEMSSVQQGFKKAMLLTLLLIYVLLAIPLKSYWQPLIIMSVIPFGFAGAIYGHGLMGLPVSLLSMFGMMAMTGVVINDSLVLMTRFNQLHREGMPLQQALLSAGKSRLRAIFLTTVTTVCGLLPLLSESSEQAQYLKPAAVSLVFGELLATPITLILVPLLLSLKQWRVPVAHSAVAK
ncbi:efflux RND transporter permease subunit [Aliagarivorans marinus]|uniref:efflux RND transporter permease subunit n=1 Tax=Aliagarivorans marinus TaxID=561965 RepID=UPI0004167E5C|nr:efflux RND transporter permease subunit [Aliagarivorans marinus]